jgi:ammonia channel protein AmtB
MYDEQLPLDAVILGSISGGIALGTPFSPFLSPTWALLIGCFCGFLVAIWIKFAQPKVAKSVKLHLNRV